MRIPKILALLAALGGTSTAVAERTQIAGPAGSQAFGLWVLTLANGNIVVADPHVSVGGISGAGAVYLYKPSGELISTVVGSHVNDNVGLNGLFAAGVNRFGVKSEFWNGGQGAVTVVDGNSGLNAAVDASNSLIGADSSTETGSSVFVLPNGNFVVTSVDVGGVSPSLGLTWCSGTAPCAGTVTLSNTLTITGDPGLGENLIALDNGNYVVSAPFWNDARGALRVCDGNQPCTGELSVANSIVGEKPNDRVANPFNAEHTIFPLPNGAFVVLSEKYSDGTTAVGAVSRFEGTPDITGTVNASNSLTGLATYDLNDTRVITLADGNYVVLAPQWNDGPIQMAGAALWCDGASGCQAHIAANQALTGAHTGDSVGLGGGAALGAGAYVVGSPGWSSDTQPTLGAATFCADHLHCQGHVYASNSLTGKTPYDSVGESITALSNGKYVVASPFWQHGQNVVTGAATLCSGATGCVGHVSAANSWITSFPNPSTFVGPEITTLALKHGHFAVYFNYGWETTPYLGSLTWADSSSPFVGVANAGNSLIGIPTDEQSPLSPLSVLPTGDYVLDDVSWKNGSLPNAGAVRLLRADSSVSGSLDATNSIIGSFANEGYMDFAYDAARDVLVVGKSEENVVILSHESDTLFRSAFD